MSVENRIYIGYYVDGVPYAVRLDCGFVPRQGDDIWLSPTDHYQVVRVDWVHMQESPQRVKIYLASYGKRDRG